MSPLELAEHYVNETSHSLFLTQRDENGIIHLSLRKFLREGFGD